MATEIQQIGRRQAFFPRARASVPAARRLVRNVLAEWGVRDRVGEILLCVGELATNAVQHGVQPGRGFLVFVSLHESHYEAGTVLRVEVHDSGDGEPRLRRGHDAERESGRGLMLVDALADSWGVGERVPGKVVWCLFEVGAAAVVEG